MMRRAGPLLTVALLSAATLAPSLAARAPSPPEGPDRPADQTFLTFPEWYLVFSPDEYARFIATQPSSRFPYLGEVAQLWQSYGAVSRATRDQPLNVGYHAMILVIASSTTVEYGARGAYETLVGRVTEALAPGPTAEDRYAARAAREYVAFIEERPWYEFDFVSRVRALWRLPRSYGAGAPRAWERRFGLTSEWLAKAAYGALITRATAASYDRPWMYTRVVLDAAPAPGDALAVVASGPDGVVVDLPRYKRFTQAALTLAREGRRFRRVAGNTGSIALSAWVRDGWTPPAGAACVVLFEQPILTAPGWRRVVLSTPVAALGATLRDLDRADVSLEHVFDY